jgi:hypothetical protein
VRIGQNDYLFESVPGARAFFGASELILRQGGQSGKKRSAFQIAGGGELPQSASSTTMSQAALKGSFPNIETLLN